jgi:hypothetical protein
MCHRNAVNELVASSAAAPAAQRDVSEQLLGTADIGLRQQRPQ